MAGAGDDMHAGLSRHLFQETNVATNVGGRDVDDGVYALGLRRLELRDHLAHERGPAAEELRPYFQEPRRAGARVLVRQGEAELIGIDRSLDRLNATRPSPGGRRFFPERPLRRRCNACTSDLREKLATTPHRNAPKLYTTCIRDR